MNQLIGILSRTLDNAVYNTKILVGYRIRVGGRFKRSSRTSKYYRKIGVILVLG